MRKVLDRPFGDLSYWISFDEEGEACGCLIGTVAIAADAHAAESWAAGSTDCSLLPWYIAGRLAGRDAGDAMGVGVRVVVLRDREAWKERLPDEGLRNAATIELLKRRIARRLGVTYAAPAVDVQHA
jgi:hypothetical protein